MKGIFIKNKFVIALNILSIISGAILAAMLPFFILLDSQLTTDTICGLVFFSFLGILVIIISILSLFFNKRAFLTLNESGISASFSWNRNFNCRYTDIAFCEYGINTLTIRLANNKYYIIPGLVNAEAICGEIRKKITKPSGQESIALAYEIQLLKLKKTKWLMWTIILSSFMFINIGLAVFLTEARDPSVFLSKDWTVLIGLGVLELVIIVAAFFCANKCGKLNRVFSEKTASLKKAILQNAPLPSGNLVQAFMDTTYTARAIVFGYPNEQDVYFVVQAIDKDFHIITTYTSAVFSSIEELKPLLDELIAINNQQESFLIS